MDNPLRNFIYWAFCRWRGHRCVMALDDPAEMDDRALSVVDWCWRCHRGLPTSFLAYTGTESTIDRPRRARYNDMSEDEQARRLEAYRAE